MTDSPLPMEVVSSTALESISRAEIDVQIATARKYPRDLANVKRSMLSFATLDQETAESCFYVLPRGGKNISGPSVRLAEIAVSCYGNLRAGSRILSVEATGNNPHVVVQAMAADLERNVVISIEKRRRITKKKSKNTIDEDDINLAANAGSAIAFRDAVFKVVPMALIKPVFEETKRVAVGDAKTLSDRRTRMLETYAKMGIQKERILAKLERQGIESINLEDIETLIGLFNAIKEGEVSIDEAFPAPKQTVEHGGPATGAPTPPNATGKPAEVLKTEKKEPAKAPEKPATAPTEPAKAVNTPSTPAKPAPEPAKEQEQAQAEGETTSEPTEQTAEPANEDEAAEAAMGLAPEQKQAKPEFKPNTAMSDQWNNVAYLMDKYDITEDQLMAELRKRKVASEKQKLSDLATAKLVNIGKIFETQLVPAIKPSAQAG